MIETWLPYPHPDEPYGYLPGSADALPAVSLDTCTNRDPCWAAAIARRIAVVAQSALRYAALITTSGRASRSADVTSSLGMSAAESEAIRRRFARGPSALADEVMELEAAVVDLVALFGIPADPVLQGTDGVQVTLDGQTAVVCVLVERLSAPDAVRWIPLSRPGLLR